MCPSFGGFTVFLSSVTATPEPQFSSGSKVVIIMCNHAVTLSGPPRGGEQGIFPQGPQTFFPEKGPHEAFKLSFIAEHLSARLLIV